jgi:hypothetical protein
MVGQANLFSGNLSQKDKLLPVSTCSFIGDKCERVFCHPENQIPAPLHQKSACTALWFGSNDPLSLFVQKEMASDEETKTNDETQTRLF